MIQVELIIYEIVNTINYKLEHNSQVSYFNPIIEYPFYSEEIINSIHSKLHGFKN
jgi:hypothetical protein